MHERSPNSIRAQHTPRKQFGQHFITDRNILNKIVRAAELEPDDLVLEIGPGLGHLTRALVENGAHVVSVEIDRDLAKKLGDEFENTAAIILQGDILKQSPEAWLAQAHQAPPYRVVANLPYYITSAILRYLLEAETPPTRLIVMVQREVAQQMTAKPPHGNLLGVSVQFYGAPRTIQIVPAGAFSPPPQVDSAIVRIDVSPTAPDIAPQDFFSVVRAGFSAKRKQLHNSLSNGLGLTRVQVEWALQRAAIDPARRAETLTLDEWRQLTRAMAPFRAP